MNNSIQEQYFSGYHAFNEIAVETEVMKIILEGQLTYLML